MRSILISMLVSIIASISLAGIEGSWTGEIEGRRGPRKIVMNFFDKDGALTGETVSQWGENERKNEMDNLKVDGDKISFTQTISWREGQFAIEYSGIVDGNSIKMTRKMGDRGSRDFTLAKVVQDVDIVGSWEGEIVGQRGAFKIKFNFTKNDGLLSGETVTWWGDVERKLAIDNVKIDGDKITFDQTFSMNDQDFSIDYTGVAKKDTIELVSKMGDFDPRNLTITKIKKPAIVGSWKGEIESRRGGTREIVFNFFENDGAVTGNTIFQMRDKARRADLDNVKIDGDNISFTQTFGREDRQFTIEYSGTVEGDSVNMSRKMGDRGTSEFTLSRMSAEEAEKVNNSVSVAAPAN